MQTMLAYSPYPSMQTGQPMMPMYDRSSWLPKLIRFRKLKSDVHSGKTKSDHMLREMERSSFRNRCPSQPMPMPQIAANAGSNAHAGNAAGADGANGRRSAKARLRNSGAQILGPGGALPGGVLISMPQAWRCRRLRACLSK